MGPVRRVRSELRDLFRAQESHAELGGRLLAVLLLSAAFDLAVTFIVNAMDEKQLHSLWLAFVWTTSQLLTGGSSLGVESRLGHLWEIVVQLWGITFVAALAGSFAAFFHRRSTERQAASSSKS
ncbi:MAG TPA: hypothetical protein VF486_24095 [Actinomycetes bacterium]